MCGINGIFSKKFIKSISVCLKKMNKSLIHRGPDNQGIKYNSKIGMGHTRLGIIDLHESANQPFISNSKRFWIAFNGEIYNFKEIKSQLDYPFKTKSDTEVIAASIEVNGIDWFLSKANGMFSIAVYDNLNEKLYLIRDRLGIKPLYYSFNNNQVVFSSEIKGILASGLIDKAVNYEAIDEYLGYRYVRAPYTFYKGIHQLHPGTYLVFDNNLKKTEYKYWKLPSEFNLDIHYNENQILEEFENALIRSVDYRLTSDVPLGTYLSGGVDSSLLTALVAKKKSQILNSYTIGFKELNEFDYSKKVSTQYGTCHHEILMTNDDYFSKWEELIKYKDSPLGVPNEIPLALMSSELKKKITVVLSGEGADELLGGYGRIFRLPFDHSNHNSNSSFYKSFIEEYEYVPRQIRDKFLKTGKLIRNEMDSKISADFKCNSNEENVFRFFHNYHVQGLLQRVDTTTMQTSVEARVPFLDHELIEFCYKKVPMDLKLRWNDFNSKNKARHLHSNEYSENLDTPKYLLRKLSYKYIPKEIIERKKVGFPVPLSNWFSDLEKFAKDLLSDSDWLEKKEINSLIKNCKDNPKSGQLLWMFLNVQLFINQFND